jgi:hypothetical protein
LNFGAFAQKIFNFNLTFSSKFDKNIGTVSKHSFALPRQSGTEAGYENLEF